MKAVVLSIIISIILLVAIMTISLNYYTNSIRSTTSQANKSGANLEETSDPINLATDVKTQVDLKNIQTSLAIYFSEYSYYPISLQELVTNGTLVDMDLSSFTYQRCDADTVVVKSGNGGFKLDLDSVSSDLSC